MTVTEHVTEPGGRAGLIARARGILLHPTAEWDVIDGEPATVGGLFTGYACILALIPPVALLIKGLVFAHWAAPFILADAILSYITALAGAFVVGLIIEALAPTFGGQKSRIQAMKLSVYSDTAAWVGGALTLIPVVGALLAVIVGLYGLYILYRGLPRLMRCPAEKTAGYFAVTLLLVVVIYVVLAWMVLLVTAPLLAGSALVGGGFVG